MRAMILAAGFGTRLRPFTEEIPKPLLPVANRPMIDYTLSLLEESGVGEVIINGHHLVDRLEEGVRRLRRSGMEVHFSRERKILGTAGGPKKAEPFFRNETFILANSDFLIDIDLSAVVDFHRRSGAAATMVLLEKRGGSIYIDDEGAIRQFLDSSRDADGGWIETGFTGFHILEAKVLSLIKKGVPWEINRQVYPEMLARGWPVYGFLHRGYWREAGDPAGFLAASMDILYGFAGALPSPAAPGTALPGGSGATPPFLVGEGATIEEGVSLGPGAVVGPGAHIGRGASLKQSVILEGTAVPANADIDGMIVSPFGTATLSRPDR